MRLLLWFGKKDPGAGVAWGSAQCVFCVGVLITGGGGERLALPSASSVVVQGSRGVRGRWQVLSIQLPLTPCGEQQTARWTGCGLLLLAVCLLDCPGSEKVWGECSWRHLGAGAGAGHQRGSSCCVACRHSWFNSTFKYLLLPLSNPFGF